MVTLKASTLVEAIVASIIIIFMFTLAIFVLVAVEERRSNFLHIRAKELIERQVAETINSRNITETVLTEQDLKLEQHPLEISANRLFRVNYSVYTSNGRLLEQQERMILLDN